jgi:hypothetical protein
MTKMSASNADAAGSPRADSVAPAGQSAFAQYEPYMGLLKLTGSKGGDISPGRSK